jgi:hypothetical protein
MLGYKTTNFDLGVIPKMVYLFGTIFKDMRIPRLAQDGTSLNELVKVPIIYASKDKTLERLRGDPNIDRKTAVTVPLLSFEHTDMVYDEARKMGAMQKYVIENSDAGTFKSQYTSVPYNFAFDLNCYAATALDLNNIIEQILGFFTPEYTARVNLIPTIGKTWDIPIVYNGFSISDGNSGQDQSKIEERRMVQRTLKFVIKGYLFGPIVIHPVIKFTTVNFIVPVANNTIEESIGNTAPIDRVTVQPGFTANGQPTTNAALSIPISEITASDDFGYVVYIAGDLNDDDPSGGE